MSAGKLPEGWVIAPVSTVTTLIRGVTYKKEQAINYLKDDYLPLIRANNIQNGKFDTTDLVFVPKNLVKESQKISPEDIVIAMSSGSKSVVGKSAHQHLPFECSFGAFCGVLRPEKLIFSGFIAHFTKSSLYRNKISSLSAGANINNIKPASFDLINIPIPPLAEQKIIAEKLDTLREALPAHVAIWKALSVGETLPAREFQHVDKYVLDNGQGGSGQRFDWSLLNGQSLGNVLLAGGLGADNCVEAAQTGCAGLDFNSAVESQPGIKDARLLASVFQTLRAY
ncbi:restriction endonuclease subunit S [Acinetobacter baumannii]